MLTRMKKMLKKQKGFTLVELLAVIAILAIIVAIAVPTIGNVIGDAESKAKEADKELVENAARLAHVSKLKPDTAGEYTITELIKGGFLDVDTSKISGKVTFEEKTDGKGLIFTYVPGS
ncbi:prepilin-type N-terminal cleavage/methylation domain-containing protein [Virgibacillus halodenitrificans]|uniref:prepilin-type N-terminal cleavage/methylation domain-containing protein n=1 Tax=Virgibacillus halodenitrificans TaxID=1482 RepID=UPI00045D0B6D|nr:prepilin-type N-terminal cleavage/methylation domain-containing protein [Virgibacillus halodenitrificans]CDQ36993.1 putative major pilin subunit [Virgibacillus halodenitrificans]